jgi:hypothetical protein
MIVDSSSNLSPGYITANLSTVNALGSASRLAAYALPLPNLEKDMLDYDGNGNSWYDIQVDRLMRTAPSFLLRRSSAASMLSKLPERSDIGCDNGSGYILNMMRDVQAHLTGQDNKTIPNLYKEKLREYLRASNVAPVDEPGIIWLESESGSSGASQRRMREFIGVAQAPARDAERAAAAEAERQRVLAEERAAAAEEAERQRVLAKERAEKQARKLRKRTMQAMQEIIGERPQTGTEDDEPPLNLTEEEAGDRVRARKKRKTNVPVSGAERALTKQYGVYMLKVELHPNHELAQALKEFGYVAKYTTVDIGFTGDAADRFRQHVRDKGDKKITVIEWLPCLSEEHAYLAEQTFHMKWRSTDYHHTEATGVPTNTEMYRVPHESLKDLHASLERCVLIAQK